MLIQHMLMMLRKKSCVCEQRLSKMSFRGERWTITVAVQDAVLLRRHIRVRRFEQVFAISAISSHSLDRFQLFAENIGYVIVMITGTIKQWVRAFAVIILKRGYSYHSERYIR